MNHNQPGMFVHFDPNKIMLPPLMGGPLPHDQLSVAPQTEIPRANRSLKRKRTTASNIPLRFNKFEKELVQTAQNESETTTKDQLKTFENMDQAMKALRDCFKQSQDVNFAASYRTHDPGVPHKQRIQTITHEIWKATGYRFTVKDHPRTKDGHKTRLWCSQDEAHRSKNTKSRQSVRTSCDGLVLAKARFPCRSGLLISSRNDEQRDTYNIIIRMHHHFAHEAYYDHTLPPEMTQSIWERVPHNDDHPSQPPTFLPVVTPEPEILDNRLENNLGNVNQEVEIKIHQKSGPEIREHIKTPDHMLMHVQQSEIVSPPFAPEIYQQRMRQHIADIRHFCDSLEYQLPYNDFRMLDILEREGGPFLRLIHCLKTDGPPKADHQVMHPAATMVVRRGQRPT